MPIVSALGAMSSRGFGEFAQSSATGKYIEDYFSTYLYTGNGSSQTINNGIGLADTAAWTGISIQDIRQDASYSTAIATDSSGNFYVTGYPGDTTNYYMVIAKYNSSNAIVWQRKLRQGSIQSYGNAITVDSSGNVYVTGFANDGTSNYILTAKYDSSGSIQWQRKLRQGSINAMGRGIAVDSLGNVCVVGNAYDGTNTYIITAQYNSSGSLQWQRKILISGDSIGYGICVDSSNNIYVCGATNGIASGIIAKYNSSGVIQWRRALSEGSSVMYSVATDSSSNVYVTGYCTLGGVQYAAVAKYNSSGVIQWQRKLTASNSTRGNFVTTDSSGNVYVAGFGYDPSQYGLVVKYNTSGVIQWQRKLFYAPINGSTTSTGISIDANGKILVYSTSEDKILSVAKLDADGTTQSGVAIVNLTIATATDAAGTATDTTLSTSDTVGGATDSAGTATDSVGTLITSSATQAAVTGAGGLVWTKSRSIANNNILSNTIAGPTKQLISNNTNGQYSFTDMLTSFLASGYTLGSDATLGCVNNSGTTYVSWTWRETPKFFDVVTWTGDGTNNRVINHNLGSAPGMIFIKATNAASNWNVYHRSIPSDIIFLERTDAAVNGGGFYVTATSSTTFTIGRPAGGNASGTTYVAYLFAHNAGGFGLDGTQNVISCGSYTGNGSATGPVINLGYEPQWLLIKNASNTYSWYITDNMRGMVVGGDDPLLRANGSDAELAGFNRESINATGFQITSDQPNWNTVGDTYIYMAIRRGPMKVPTDATTVYQPTYVAGNGSYPRTIGSLSTVDFVFDLGDPAAGAPLTESRLQGNNNYLIVTSTDGEYTASPFFTLEQTGKILTGIRNTAGFTYGNQLFRRAPSFMDVVCYSGTATPKTVAHNLGTAPELIITKVRSSNGYWWAVYAAPIGPQNYLLLNDATLAASADSTYWNNTAPTSSVFTVGANSRTNLSGGNLVAYLFSSCPGVSKVGSYTGTGSTQTIDCGFAGGARYVLIRRTDAGGNWWTWDTARGMVAGNDLRYSLNSGTQTNSNWVYTTTGGFQIVTSDATVNANGGTYLYLAIA